MQKIPTLFKKDPQDLSRVLPEIDPQNEWVNTPVAVATRKFDGTACAIINHLLYRRYDVKLGKKAPEGAIPCMEPANGHHTHWIPCDFQKSEDRYFFEGLANCTFAPNGTYELCGPKINGNNEKLEKHILIPHAQFILKEVPRDFEGLKAYLEPESNDIEGIVFHNMATGQMCKIRKKDFGIRRAVK